jgi:DNA-binding transcriptional LysR family regulator
LQVDAILTGRVHIGFLTLPAQSDELAIEIVQRDHLVVAMAKKHPLASRRAVPIRALAEETLIIYPRHLNAKRHDLITGMCRNSGFSPRIMHEVDNIQVTMELVSRGLGVSVMRPPLFDTLNPGVVLRNLQHSPLLETAVVYRRSDRSSVVDDFVRAAKGVASSHPSPHGRTD